MSQDRRFRILIADDHPVVRAGLRGLLDSVADFQVVAEAADGLAAVAQAQAHQPDVALLDLRMPGLDGTGAAVQIRAACPGTQVLILSTYEADRDIQAALRAGARGYLLKDTPPDDLFRAIRAVAAGQTTLGPSLAERLLHSSDTAPQQTLSEREVAVLDRVARGLTNAQIGRSLHISTATVKTHLNHIFGKLDVPDRAAAVAVAIKRGLLSLEDDLD